MTHVKQSSSSQATQSAFAEMVPLAQARSSARISTGDARGFFFDLLKSSFL
jgi:hypothetical protein